MTIASNEETLVHEEEVALGHDEAYRHEKVEALTDENDLMMNSDKILRAMLPLPELPFRVDHWRLLLQIPEPAETTEGGIVIPEEYRDRKEFSTYVGLLRDVGPLAYDAVTRSGLHLSRSNRPGVGEWVIFSKHAGERIRTTDGTLWIVISDTEILGTGVDPLRFDYERM